MEHCTPGICKIEAFQALKNCLYTNKILQVILYFIGLKLWNKMPSFEHFHSGRINISSLKFVLFFVSYPIPGSSCFDKEAFINPPFYFGVFGIILQSGLQICRFRDSSHLSPISTQLWHYTFILYNCSQQNKSKASTTK